MKEKSPRDSHQKGEDLYWLKLQNVGLFSGDKMLQMSQLRTTAKYCWNDKEI